MTEKLKPCPFCGGKAKLFNIYDCYSVICQNCDSKTDDFLHDKYGAIKAWNKRPSTWHTGTPTEEGWYLVQHLTDAEYCGSKFFVARWDGEKFVINPRQPIVVTYPNGTAWQKIEPFVEASDYECPHYKGVCGLDESIVCFSKSNRNCDIRLGASGKASFDCSAPNCLDCERNDECNHIGLFERLADD